MCHRLKTGCSFNVENQKGFSLVELLVAIVILAVAIIGIISLLPQSYNHIGNAGRLSIMNHLGQQKLDQLKTLAWSDPNLAEGIHPSPTPPQRFTYVDSSGANIYQHYTVTWQVIDGVPQTDMKTVIVEVGHQLWDSNNTKIAPKNAMNQQIIHFQTYISR